MAIRNLQHPKEKPRQSSKISDLTAALRFVMDETDEMINRLYGGELPCTEEQAAQWAKARQLAAE